MCVVEIDQTGNIIHSHLTSCSELQCFLEATDCSIILKAADVIEILDKRFENRKAEHSTRGLMFNHVFVVCHEPQNNELYILNCGFRHAAGHYHHTAPWPSIRCEELKDLDKNVCLGGARSVLIQVNF